MTNNNKYLLSNMTDWLTSVAARFHLSFMFQIGMLIARVSCCHQHASRSAGDHNWWQSYDGQVVGRNHHMMKKTATKMWFVHSLTAVLINTGRQPVMGAKQLITWLSQTRRNMMSLQRSSVLESVPQVVLKITTFSCIPSQTRGYCQKG